MLRFIDLRGQIYLDDEPCFAWFTTISDGFYCFAGSQEWSSLEDFISDYNEEANNNEMPYPLERFLKLIPDGYFGEVSSPPTTNRICHPILDFKVPDLDHFKEYPIPLTGHFNCSGKYIWPDNNK